MMFVSLAELDAAIEAASQILQMSRECGFQDCVTPIVEDIRQVILPGACCFWALPTESSERLSQSGINAFRNWFRIEQRPQLPGRALQNAG